MLGIIYFLKVIEEVFFSHTVRRIRTENLQVVTMIPQAYPIEDAMVFSGHAPTPHEIAAYFGGYDGRPFEDVMAFSGNTPTPHEMRHISGATTAAHSKMPWPFLVIHHRRTRYQHISLCTTWRCHKCLAWMKRRRRRMQQLISVVTKRVMTAIIAAGTR
jgi:hypothetical protein